MNKFKKLTVALISAMMISSCFAGCSDEEYEDTLYSDLQADIMSEYDAQNENRAGAKEIEIEYLTDDGGKRPMKNVSDIKFIPGEMYNGQNIAEEDYIFRRQLSDEHKKIYDSVRAAMLQGKETCYLPFPIPLEDAKKIYASVLNDSGDIFWNCHSVGFYTSRQDRNLATGIVLGYYEDLLKNLPDAKIKMEEATQHVLAIIQSMDKDIDKVKYAHDYIIANVTYVLNDGYDQSAYDALVNKKCVCAGYARSMQYLMQKSGIPCTYVTSKSHAWNVLELDGELYEMDVCWDDHDLTLEEIQDDIKKYNLKGQNAQDYIRTGTYGYTYFNITSDKMKVACNSACSQESHVKDQYSSTLPEATATKYNFFNYYGKSLDNFGTDFTKYADIKIPQKVKVNNQEENSWWENGNYEWWNKFDINVVKSDWKEIKPGIYTYKNTPNKSEFIYWEKANKYFAIFDDGSDLYRIDDKTGMFLWLSGDYRTYTYPSVDDKVPSETTVVTTEETKPTETTVVTTEETKPTETTVVTTEEIKPTETTVVTTEETKPTETTIVTTEERKPAETTKGWWNVLDSSWTESDWTMVNEDLYKIYDTVYETTYYWKPSARTYYAVIDGYEDSCYKVDQSTGDWVSVDMSEINGETSGENKPDKTTPVTTVDDTNSWNDDYNDNSYNDDDIDDYYDYDEDDSYDWLW